MTPSELIELEKQVIKIMSGEAGTKIIVGQILRVVTIARNDAQDYNHIAAEESFDHLIDSATKILTS